MLTDFKQGKIRSVPCCKERFAVNTVAAILAPIRIIPWDMGLAVNAFQGVRSFSTSADEPYQRSESTKAYLESTAEFQDPLQ